ncbi:MAG: hypothetical protein JO329_21565, partial [Planctomycetaceae bacterium]|nr:hypothetical protein [Planctomycetaceae bacterium]
MSPTYRRGLWLVLAAALVWVVVVRVPLVLNAESHLDSDLAVDGLTLGEAVRGHWRWHYPGTPHIGTLPVLLSWPQACAWGANPIMLVSGGTVAYVGLVAATFLLTWRAFGPPVAAWGLVPLAFASTGVIWLSGRITGGHLPAAAWHAGAFALLHAALANDRPRDVLALGLWCGLGVSLDTMFLVTLASLLPAAAAGWWLSGRSRRGLLRGLLVVPAFLAGAWPSQVGARLDPYDAYQDQFRPIFRRDVLEGHARVLVRDCLPRLFAGHRLPGLQADPDLSAPVGPGPSRGRPDPSPLAAAATAAGLALALASTVALIAQGLSPRDAAQGAVCLGLLASSAAVVAGSMLNRNIFNSDNYRYLVDLLVPWSIGSGLTLRSLARRGPGGLAAAVLLAATLAGLMTLDTTRWYARFGWIDAQGRPVHKPLDDPALAWLEAHPEVRRVLGGYWDIYRLSFLTGGRVQGVPYPIYPDRFPEWSRPPSGGPPDVLLIRPSPEAWPFLESALRSGGRVLHQARGIAIVSWPGWTAIS